MGIRAGARLLVAAPPSSQRIRGIFPMRVCLVLVALLVGCTTSSGQFVPLGDSSSPQRGSAVSAVFVSLDEGSLASDRSDSFQAHDGADRIRNALVSQLEDRGLLDPTSPATLQISVVGFRLRSTNNALWNGSMAGGDNLSVEASVRVNGQPAASYTASASSLRGGLFWPGSGGRFENLADNLARELAEEMSAQE